MFEHSINDSTFRELHDHNLHLNCAKSIHTIAPRNNHTRKHSYTPNTRLNCSFGAGLKREQHTVLCGTAAKCPFGTFPKEIECVCLAYFALAPVGWGGVGRCGGGGYWERQLGFDNLLSLAVGPKL